MADVFEAPAEFNARIIGIDPPAVPTMLPPKRVAYVKEHLGEELTELGDAQSVADQADALLDIIFIASGRLFEMGLSPRFAQALWDEVCWANSKRVRGDNAKRPNAVGFDAVKPEGWEAPDLEGMIQRYTSATGHVEAMRPPVGLIGHRARPKVILLGHARHGKDTVAEMMRDHHGFAFQSSSMFLAERVIMPYFEAIGEGYDSVEECYEDRVNHRDTWFSLISNYNYEDPARLCRELFETNDVYVGMRSAREFEKAVALADHVVWVDASGRGLPPEPSSSFDISRTFAADRSKSFHVLDNSGTLEDLEGAVASLMNTIL